MFNLLTLQSVYITSNLCILVVDISNETSLVVDI